jgi:ankyrin repeat protein
LVRLFLEFGADVTSYLTGFAPVEIAARSGHIAVIQVLIEFGADIHETGKGGSPPLVSAAAAGQVDCLAYIVSELGANLRQCDLQGQSALHVAVRLPEPLSCIHYLLRAGIDTKIVNNKGLTAIQVALALSNIAALEALGGRHLETEGTRTMLEDTSSLAESFLDSSLGEPSSSSKMKLSPLRTLVKQNKEHGGIKGQSRS